MDVQYSIIWLFPAPIQVVYVTKDVRNRERNFTEVFKKEFLIESLEWSLDNFVCPGSW